MFDIVSEEQKKQYDDSIKAGKEPKKFFDLDFYNDQKGQRIQYIEIGKVTAAFDVEAERQMKRADNIQRRRESALGVASAPINALDDYESSTVSSQTSQSTATEITLAPIASTDLTLAVDTRSKGNEEPKELKTFISRSTETEENLLLDEIAAFPNFSTRMNKKGRACHPRYPQAGLLMMALNNQSPQQAVMNMYIVDKIVYRQKRLLPLRLRKDYQKQLQFLKKYASFSYATQEENDVISQIGPGNINHMEGDAEMSDIDVASDNEIEDDQLEAVMDEVAFTDDADFTITPQVDRDIHDDENLVEADEGPANDKTTEDVSLSFLVITILVPAKG